MVYYLPDHVELNIIKILISKKVITTHTQPTQSIMENSINLSKKFMKYKIKRIKDREFKNIYWNHIGPSWFVEQNSTSLQKTMSGISNQSQK